MAPNYKANQQSLIEFKSR